MLWTMLTIVVNLSGGQPVVLPGYQFGTKEACEAAAFTTKELNISALPQGVAIVSAVCVPLDTASIGPMMQE